MSSVIGSDQLTAADRIGACDCLVELTTVWLSRCLEDMRDDERGDAINEVCLWVAQMRHWAPKVMDAERRRWLERVAMKLCHVTPGASGHEAIVLQNLESRTTIAMLMYHEWRETHAPHVTPKLKRAG